MTRAGYETTVAGSETHAPIRSNEIARMENVKRET